jgi:hypothetical protein
MVRILLRPTHSYELEACLDVRDMSTAGERAAWVRTRLIYILRRLKCSAGTSLNWRNLGTSTRSCKVSMGRMGTPRMLVMDTSLATPNLRNDTSLVLICR